MDKTDKALRAWAKKARELEQRAKDAAARVQAATSKEEKDEAFNEMLKVGDEMNRHLKLKL
jgi:hypothetical protein